MDSQHSMPAHGGGRAFCCSLLFHTGLCGNCVIYIHSKGRNGLDTICTHYILFLAVTFDSHCRPIGLFGTDIYLSKYVSGYLKGKKNKKKKRTVFIKSLIASWKLDCFRYSKQSLQDIIKENVTVTCWHFLKKNILYLFVLLSSLNLAINTAGSCGSLDGEKYFTAEVQTQSFYQFLLSFANFQLL